MIPQLIYIALTMISLGMTFSKHGEPKNGIENGWTSLISACILFAILYYGGFFNPLLKCPA